MPNSNSKQIVDFDLLLRVLVFAKPYKKQFIIASLAAITLSVLGPLRPYLITNAVDNYIIIPNPEGLFKIISLIFFMLIIEAIMQFVYIYLSTWIGQHVIQDLRSLIFKHIISLKMRYFDNTPIGTLVTRSISDIETIADIFSQGLLVIMAESLRLLVVLFVMFYTDWKLAIISMLTIPALLIATAWFKRNIKSAFEDIRDQVSKLNTFVQEHIVGMNIVQIFNREEAEFNKFHDINNNHLLAHLKSIFYYAVFFPIVEILSATSIALIVWYGGVEILSGKHITIGELMGFILLIHMMFRPIRQLADRFNILQMGIVGSDRVFKVLDIIELKEEKKGVLLQDLSGDISFNNVSFYYKKDQWVLQELNFNISKGKLLALVGSTGAGKTSIINILNRFYDIQAGSIKIDGVDINKIRIDFLRNNISLVSQDVFLFSDSIINNISLYDNSITKQKIIASAKEIGIHKFISSLPGSYNYIVGERGVTLSSGQRQLLAFLRVYVRDVKILILDEATSSIDTENELIIQNALKVLSKNRTTIVIAHRLSTIINADKILYLKDGRVREEGTHNQLIKEKGLYYNMYNSQL